MLLAALLAAFAAEIEPSMLVAFVVAGRVTSNPKWRLLS